jgi:CheY-like chemotaxis protein/HPt (histidine-containing phosphotransfer) domain-containing protein
VEVSENGQQAIDRLSADPARYQLVLMDVHMPVMDGISATRGIREELRLALPILAISAGVLSYEREQCLSAGMDGFIAKPIDADQMLATIRQHLPAALPAATAPTSPKVQIAATPVIDDLAVFDVGPLLNAGKDDQDYVDTLIALIRKIVSNGLGPIAEAQLAWQEGRHGDAARSFHTLRGSLGYFGAQRFAATALQIELAIHDNDRARVDALFPRVEDDLQATLAAAQRWLAREGRPTSNRPAPADIEPAQLEELCALLQQQNLDACQHYERMRPALLAELGSDGLIALDVAMDRLDFHAALALVQPMLKTGANPLA